jgi:hypothetical protein
VAVSVEVGRNEGRRPAAGRQAHLGREGPVTPAAQHRHVVGAPVGRGQVESAVVAEVGGHQGARRQPHGKGRLRREGAVAVAPQHRHVVRAGVGRGQVELAVAVEIAGDDAVGRVPHRVIDGGGKRAVPVVQEDGDHVAAGARDGQVEPAVVVEIAGDQRVGTDARVIRDRVAERPIPVAQQDGHGAVGVGRGQVEFAVVVEIAGDKGGGERADVDVLPGEERTVSGAEVDGHVVGPETGRGEVRRAVAGKVAGHDALGLATHSQQLTGRRGGGEVRADRVTARAVAQPLHFQIVARPRGRAREVHVDQVVPVAGGLAVALHQDLAVGRQQRQAGGPAGGGDLGGEPAGIGDSEGVICRRLADDPRLTRLLHILTQR